VIGVLDAALARLRLALKALSRLDFVSAPSPRLRLGTLSHEWEREVANDQR